MSAKKMINSDRKKRGGIYLAVLVITLFLFGCSTVDPNRDTGTITEFNGCLASAGFVPCATIELSANSTVRALCGEYISCDELKIGQSVTIIRDNENVDWEISKINE